MLKESENEETKPFCQIFIIGGISIEGGPGPLGHPPGCAYGFEIRSRLKVLS